MGVLERSDPHAPNATDGNRRPEATPWAESPGWGNPLMSPSPSSAATAQAAGRELDVAADFDVWREANYGV
jgi:hypothetical protein